MYIRISRSRCNPSSRPQRVAGALEEHKTTGHQSVASGRYSRECVDERRPEAISIKMYGLPASTAM